jgi:mannosyl-oligosaccharide glucosidase
MLFHITTYLYANQNFHYYVSGLFPFLLQIVDPGSSKLQRILSDIEDPEKLFTPFGLRSLSKEASAYMKKNTEHDAPYWSVESKIQIAPTQNSS